MELTDLEICKRIAEIEGFTVCNVVADSLITINKPYTIEGIATTIESFYKPLTDDLILMPLAFKYKVSICWWNMSCTIVDASGNILSEVLFSNIKLSRAILVCIIEANNEQSS